MAFTITNTPPAYSSVHDDLVYTVAFPDHVNDPANYPNFKFIGDVYIGATMVARIKKVPDPTTGIGIFNVGQVIRSYLENVFNPTANVVVAQKLGDGVFSLSITMKFGEEFAFTATLNSVVDTARIFFNNYNGRLVGTTSSLVAFTNKVASNRPLINQTFLTTAFNFIPYFPTSTSAVTFTVTPTGGGSVYSTTFTPTAANELQLLNVGPAALNAVAPGTINASTKSYTVLIGSQTYTFKVICESQYQTFMIHFLNQYGGFESKLFTKVSRKSFSIEKKDFGKLAYNVDGAGVVTYKNSNGVYNESRSVYSSIYKEQLNLNSDLLTDLDYAWLADLIISPMVYVESGGYFFPCLITDTNYETRKVINDGLTNLAISIEYGNQLNAQFR